MTSVFMEDAANFKKTPAGLDLSKNKDETELPEPKNEDVLATERGIFGDTDDENVVYEKSSETTLERKPV